MPSLDALKPSAHREQPILRLASLSPERGLARAGHVVRNTVALGTAATVLLRAPRLRVVSVGVRIQLSLKGGYSSVTSAKA